MPGHYVEPDPDMTARLEELLQQARNLKRETTIDPPLPVSELHSNEGPLLGAINGDPEMHKTVIERTAKHLYYAILVS